MPTFNCRTFGELNGLIAKHNRNRQRRIKTAVKRAARKGSKVAQGKVPIAFRELQESVHAEDHTIIADAPHAAPVEEGSRPHTPPLEPLIAWVKLRGMQGVHFRKRQLYSKKWGPTTAKHAISIAEQFAAHRRGGGSGPEASFTSLDAPIAIARAIQRAISIGGTKASRYMYRSIPEVVEILGQELDRSVPDKD